jgi:hypothetical protein
MERVVFLNATKEVDTTVLAGVALNGSILVHNRQLGCVRCDGDRVSGNHANNGKEGAFGFPAL